MIEGDIDLTKNLDFYRKKPKKLLPANVKLSNPVIERRKDSRENKTLYTNLTSNYYNDSEDYSSSNHINISNGSTTIRIRTSSYNFTYYLTNNINRYNEITDDDLNNSISNVSIYSNGETIYSTTFNYRSSITTYTISAACKNAKLNKPLLDDLEDVEPDFKLWKHRKKKENKGIIHLTRCHSCGKIILSINNKEWYNDKCISCKRKYSYSNKILWLLGRNKPKSEYKCIPWVTYEEQSRKKMNWIKSDKCSIPWLNKLNSRIRREYLKDLEDEDRDNSAYLTNMGWIGIRRNVLDEEENEHDSIIYQDLDGTISTLSSNIIDAV